MPDAEHIVRYKAIADFTSLYREVAKARAELASLRAEQGRLSAAKASTGGQHAGQGELFSREFVQNLNSAITKQQQLTKAVEEHTKAVDANNSAVAKRRPTSLVQQEKAETERIIRAEKLAALRERNADDAATRAAKRIKPDAQPTVDTQQIRAARQLVADHNLFASGQIANQRKVADAADKAGAAILRGIRERSDAEHRAAERRNKDFDKSQDQMWAAAAKLNEKFDREQKRVADKTAADAKRAADRTAADASRAADKAVADAKRQADALDRIEKLKQRNIVAAMGQARRLREGEEARAARSAEQTARRAEREAEQSARAAERATQRARRSFDTRVSRSGILGNFANVGRNVAKEFAEGFSELDKGATKLERMKAGFRNLGQAIRAGSGGRGTGGVFDPFLEAGDRAVNLLQKLGRGMLSWKGLIVLALSALGPLIAALGSLGGVALGAGNVLVSLAGTLAALPGLFAAAAAGVGALIVGILPLAGAFKAFSTYQKQAAAGAQQMGESQRAAADRVRNAQRAYQSASKGIADAVYNERQAQLSLNAARKDALRDLEDLRAELNRSALNEEAAQQAVARARQSYRETLAEPNSTLLDRQEALHRVKEAEEDLADVRTRNKRLAEDAVDIERKGVENSDKVVQARHAAQEATQAVADAVDRLRDAQLDLAQAQKEQAAGGAAGLKALQAYQDELAKLSPSARAVVLGLIGMADAWKAVQRNVSERLFAPVVSQLGNLRSLLPVVEDLLGRSADQLGILAAKGIAMVSSGPWKRDFATIAGNNAAVTKSLGDAALYVADAFRNIIIAAGPFTTWLAGAITGVAEAFADWTARARGDGSLGRFLEETKDRLKRLWDIGVNLASVFGSFYLATRDFATWMLDGAQRITKGWADVTKQQTETGSTLQQWLTDIQPLLQSIGGFIHAIGSAFAQMARDPKNIEEAQRIFAVLANDILPKLVELFSKISSNGAITGILEALATGLEAVNAFIDNTGGLPLQMIVFTLQGIAGFFKFVASNPATGTILAGVAVALAGFAAISLAGKLTGMFQIWAFMRWIINNKGDLKGGFLDKLLGRTPGDTASRRRGEGGPDGRTSIDRAGDTHALAARHLDQAADLLKVAARELTGKGAALMLKRAASALSHSALSLDEAALDLRGRGPRPTTGGTGPAIRGDHGQMLAEERETNILLRRILARMGGAGLGRDIDVDRDGHRVDEHGRRTSTGRRTLSDGRRVDPNDFDELDRRVRDRVRVPDTDVLDDVRGVRGAAAKAGRFGRVGRALGGVGRGVGRGALGLADLASWFLPGDAGLALDLGLTAADTVGDIRAGRGAPRPGPATRGVPSVYDDIAKARSGGRMGRFLEPAGRALGTVGRVAGRLALPLAIADAAYTSGSAAYDLATDAKARRNPLTWATTVSPAASTITPVASFIGKHLIAPLLPKSNKASDPDTWSQENLTKSAQDAPRNLGKLAGKGWDFGMKNILEPLGRFFADLGHQIADAAKGAGRWVNQHLVQTVVGFFLGVGRAITGLVAGAGRWVNEHLVHPVIDFFAGIGRTIGKYVSDFTGFVYDKFIQPFLAIFLGVGDAIVFYAKQVPGWINEHVIRPFIGFFVDAGRWIAKESKAIGRWINTYVIQPFIGFFVGIGSWIAEQATAAAEWANTYVIQPFVGFLASIGSWIAEQAAAAGEWINAYVIQPFIGFFLSIGAWIAAQAQAIGGWINDNVVQPVVGVFVGIGTWISNAVREVGSWINTNVLQPFVGFFVSIGTAIVSAAVTAQQWVNTFIVKPIGDFFSAVGQFIVDLPSKIERLAENLPLVGRFIKEENEKTKRKQSGGIVEGTFDGRADTIPAWLTAGEYVVRKRVVDKPGARALLADMNEERLDPATLYAALDIATRQPTTINARYLSPAGAVNSTTINNSTRNAGMAVGDITINNPVRERSDRSMRRTLQTLAYMSER